MTLRSALDQHFRFQPGQDNLPIVAKPNPGREHGRLQLAKVMKTMGFTTGIEVGVALGVSARIWIRANPDLKLVGVDPYFGSRPHTQRRKDQAYVRAQACADKVGFTLLRMKSMEAVDQFEDESVDFVHIDGDHTFDACVQDIIRYAPKVRKGGLVLVHDYCSLKTGGIMKAVDGYTHCHRIDPWYVTRDCSPTAFWERGTERA